MDFFKKVAASDLGKTMMAAAQKTVEEKLKEMQASNTPPEDVMMKKELTPETSGPIFDADTDEKHAASYRSLRQYAASNGLPHWLFAPIDIIIRSNLTIAYLEKVAQLEHINDPQFMGIVHNGTSIVQIFTKYPEDYQEVLIKYVSPAQINAKNVNGETSMHIMFHRGNLRGAILLWSYGGDLNVLSNKGLYPMDSALLANNDNIVKLCFALNAKCHNSLLKYQSNASKTCAVLIANHLKHIESVAKSSKVVYDSGNPSHVRCQNRLDMNLKGVIALAIDGGGMKGVLALQLLKEIERVCKEKFISSVKLIGGTSTGSIITLGLSKYKCIDTVIKSYFRLKNEVFVGSRPYSGEGLEKALMNEFGELTLEEFGRMSGMEICMPVARVDVSPPSLYLFRSYEFKSSTVTASPIIGKDCAESKWSAAKVSRASSAAPSFFPPVDGKYMDGGLVANNPTLEILSDLQRWKFERKEPQPVNVVVSIGTGALEKKVNQVDVVRPSNFLGFVNTVTQIIHLKDILIDQITASDGSNVDRARWMAEAMNMPYFRFTPNLAFPVAIDEKDDIALVEAMLAVKYDSLSMINSMKMLEAIL